MSIFNRRNAVIGWLALAAGKRMAKRKARNAVPSIDAGTKRPNRPAIAAGLLALGGALMFWRKRKSDDSESFG
jgi:LPXTG-motif cell wall-anchored protein